MTGKTNMANINGQALVDAMEKGVKDIMGSLIDGTIEDLDGPIRDISARLAYAARRNRLDLVAACRDQLQLLALEKRLRIEQEGNGILDTILTVGVNALINGALGGLGSLR